MTTQLKLMTMAVLVAIAGCASLPEPPPELDAARAAFDQAKQDEEVLRYASGELDQAQQTLARASGASTLEDMKSLAYVANAQVQLAQAIAQRNVAEKRVEQLNTVKDRVQLEVREAELEASREQLAELQARETDRGTLITLGSVLFATGRAELLPGAMSTVDRLADYLQSNPRKTVLIEGHTDSTGSDETNLRLSQQRAESVRNALVRKGIDARRIVATGLGSSRPVASNDTSAGRQQNRRVEIIIQ